MAAPQPAPVSYTYDNANRLTQISQSSTSTSFSYDNSNRRTSLTLPNGVAVSYSYDNDSRLTGISYQYGSSSLGNLAYSYDLLGRRTQVGGSFARTGLPGGVGSATYDAANELTNWGGLNLSYDANGNMLSDGSNAFTWNARNQVSSLNNVSLQYDAFGRRVQNLAGTSFLYDGENAVQELSGSTVTANLLSGGVDEVFARTDSSGAFTQLKDALGSTIALVDANGNVDTSYTYDPFGNTSVTGSSNANEFQYTGRENEGNGLYFYRARYYSPLLGRFVNEDPLGFGGSGPNVYAYVGDDPIDFSDPFGLARGDWWDPRSYYTDGWTTLQDFGTAAEAFTDTITFGSASRLNDALGAGGMVDRCGIGHKLASASGIVASIAIIPNISSWAQNPVLYEVGSTTVPSAVYEGMQGMNAIQKGSYLLSNYGWMGTLRLAGQAALSGEYANTIGTGLTPGGWLAVIAASNVTSSLTKPKCGCK